MSLGIDGVEGNDSDSVCGRHLAVVGMMGAGKTSFARALATRLGRPYFDSDESIEARYGYSGGVLAESHGVARLHEIEAELVFEQLASSEPCVFSIAASVVENAECCAALGQSALVFWIDAPVDVLLERMAAGDHRRSMTEAELVKRFAKRSPKFERLADIRVDAMVSTALQVNLAVAELNERS